MTNKRRAGVLMHITSLPGRYGTGVMGKDARNFIDSLNEMGFRYWQVLPLNPTDDSGSPYCSYSAFAGNISLIDPETMVQTGLVSENEARECEYVGSVYASDHEFAYNSRLELLKKAFARLDGTTKEDYAWGLRVGFISFAFKGASDAQLKALEAKAAGNVRSGISNVSSIGQQMAIKAFKDPDYAKQKQAKYKVLERRYAQIRRIFREHPEYGESYEGMPFNSGYFMCVKPKGVDAEAVRRHLIEKYSIGTIVLSGLLRLAFSTIPLKKLDGLYRDVAAAVLDLRK